MRLTDNVEEKKCGEFSTTFVPERAAVLTNVTRVWIHHSHFNYRYSLRTRLA